jgi:hypothetical protein
MPNKFLDHGLQQNKRRELPNSDSKQGFVDAVRNNQAGLALSYLVNLLNNIVDEVRGLGSRITEIENHLFGKEEVAAEAEVEESAPVAEEPAKAEPVAKKPRRTSTAKQAADESESQD